MDLYLFNLINGLADKWKWLDFLGIFFARYSEYVLWLILILFLFLSLKKYGRMVFESLAAGILSKFIITNIIRLFWNRPRPFDVVDVNLLLKIKDEASFPSGHASFYFALSAVIFLYNKKLGYLFFAISFLMVISRVFVGYHWPSDILAGVVIGVLTAWLLNKLLKRKNPQ